MTDTYDELKVKSLKSEIARYKHDIAICEKEIKEIEASKTTTFKQNRIICSNDTFFKSEKEI